MTFGLNHVNFGARTYNPTIGRFTSVDAMAEKFYGQSTYSIAGNNTVNSIDPDGNDYYEGEAAQEMFRRLQNRYGNRNGEDDDDKKKKSGSKNTEKKPDDSKCLTCLNPSTIGQNIFGLIYPGGDNPKNYLGDYDYSYAPTNIAEYPAIGHDRRYDQLKIEGASGLLTDTKAIGADWKFVSEEIKISLMPIKPKERLQALGLGVGLGLAATPKTLYKLATDKYAISTILLYYKASSLGVNNKPTVDKQK